MSLKGRRRERNRTNIMPEARKCDGVKQGWQIDGH